MKWMLLTALSLSVPAVHAQEPLNPFQCGYYTQESQDRELKEILVLTMEQITDFAASDFKKDLEGQGVSEFSALSLTLKHHHRVLMPTAEVSLKAFDLRAQEEGSAVRVIKNMCHKADTSFLDMFTPLFDHTSIELMKQLNQERNNL